MKKTVTLSILLFLASAFYANAGERHAPGNGYDHGRGHSSHGNGNGYGHTKGSVGAPLDGGLLLLLGGAGVAYYASRKKKENS
jgi:hypothetical protein